MTTPEPYGPVFFERQQITIDRSIVENLSTLPEHAVLDLFWLVQHYEPAKRRDLLTHYTHVAIARSREWNPRDVRDEHERKLGAFERRLFRDTCFVCADSDTFLVFHHIIGIAHGGSNDPRNKVPLCQSCHADLHPWLEHQPRRIRGFESLGQIMRWAVPKLLSSVVPSPPRT